MSLVLAMDDVKPDQVTRKGIAGSTGLTTTTFFRSSPDSQDSPTVFVARQDPGFKNSIHYHAVDEFQIIVEGKGKFGRHDVSPYHVHFARAYTPYGPLLPGQETGWAFMTLRAHYDPGAQHLPATQEKLKQIPDRRPWQITKQITFPAQGPGISLQEVPGIKDDQGLFACSLTMAPNTRTVAPDPSGGDGQFVVVVKGSLVHGDREHKALTAVHVRPEEAAFQIHAGAQGLEGLILNLPQVKPRAVDARKPSAAAGFKKWQCVLCAFAYDEALGMPGEGIPAGTRWNDVPDTWSCPDCAASKRDFEMIEVS
jgi:rubredoxin